jgi:hypothetical protein
MIYVAYSSLLESGIQTALMITKEDGEIHVNILFNTQLSNSGKIYY